MHYTLNGVKPELNLPWQGHHASASRNGSLGLINLFHMQIEINVQKADFDNEKGKKNKKIITK